MIYNNLIYFLVVIFVLSTDKAPTVPRVDPVAALPLLVMFYVFYAFICRKIFYRVRHNGARSYFAAETKLSILAVGLFTVALHLLDLKYYLHPLSLGDRLPVLENIGGLVLFLVFLSLMWEQGRPYYQVIFGRVHTIFSFILSNIKANLAIIAPWVVLSFLFDLLALLKIPGLQELLNTPWGDLILFSVFILFLLFFFPPLIRILWDCRPLPPGPLRQRMEMFFRQQGFSADIFLWPFFEGQVITAGVMGLIPRFRYLLVTPALLSALNWEELKAVLAHEIGHVKKKHLLLYIFLFLGFSLFAGAAGEPLLYLVVSSEQFYRLADLLQVSPDVLVGAAIALPGLLFMILYFRYLFGYFIRNFERQADLYVFKAIGESSALVSSFEKIALLGGNIRDQKSWHHFGIGERIDFLERCERDKNQIRRHDRKVYFSLGLYFVVVAIGVLMLNRVDYGSMAAGYEIRYIESVLEHKMHQDPERGLLLLVLGDLLQKNKMEGKAIAAYEQALQVSPRNADIHNNLAWLLLTARDPDLRDPARALVQARRAAKIKPSGYILDTLAVALWANGKPDEAAAAETRAIEVDPGNARYYREQKNKILGQTWDSETP